ncbi:MAG TPA: hypothetical protein PKU70_13865, partial [Vicinamibacteria bacterium]|nr:hypothetical protein [Vicinamibacteria bacterium]
MRRAIASIILVCLALASSPAMAADEWKELYLDAKDKDLRNRRYEDAIKHLTRALAEKPASSLGERSYSLEFFNYFPHYQLGRAYMGLQRREDAIASFKEEERQGQIQKIAADYQDLKRLLKEAEDRQNQETIRALRQQLDRLLSEAADLDGRDRIDEAIAKAQEAMARARNLDPAAQARVTSVLEGLRQKQTQKDTEARLQREREQLQRDIAEARRLLNAGQHRDALVKFDAILKTDPGNVQARDGRTEALDRLLATTTRQSRLKDLADGRRLFEAGSIEAAIPLLTEAATDETLTEAVTLLKRAQDMSAQRKKRQEGDRRIGELRREVLQLLSQNNFTEASLRLNLILGLVPGDDDATRRLADIDERMARDARDLLLGDRELPALAFVAPKQVTSETQEDTITVSGVATDDRGLARITIRSGALVTHSTDLSKEPGARTHTFDESVPLGKGLNRVVVSVVDRKGRTFETVFTVD